MFALIVYYVCYQLSSLELWGVTSVIFDVRQGKRLFGVISAGDIPAKMMGYLTYLLFYVIIKKFTGDYSNYLPFLYILSFSFFAISYFGLERIIAYLNLPGEHQNHEEKSNAEEAPVLRFFKRKFIFALSVLSFITIFTLTHVEFNFLVSVNRIESLVIFIAAFYGVLHLIISLIKIFLSYRIIQKLGLLRSLLLLPASLIAVTIPTFFFGSPITVLGQTNFLDIWIMLVSILIYYSIQNPLFLSLFQPLEQELMLFGHTMVKGLINPLAMLFGGISLLLMVHFFGLGINEPVHALIIGIATIWIGVCIWVEKEYFLEIKDSIKKKWFFGDRLFKPQSENKALLLENLNSNNPLDVIYSMDLMERLDQELYHSKLPEALEAKDEGLLRYALRKYKDHPDIGHGKKIWEIATSSNIDAVRKDAIISYCLQDDAEIEYALALLDSDNDLEREASIIGLIFRGDVESIVFAGQALLGLVNDKDRENHFLALKIIEELGIKNFYRPVLRFLQSEEPDLCLQAIRASGEVRNERFIPVLLDLIMEPSFRIEAQNALSRIGEEAIGPIIEKLNGEGSIQVKASLIKCLGRNGGPEAIDCLIGMIDYPHLRIRIEVIRALLSAKYEPTTSAIRQMIIDRIVHSISICKMIRSADISQISTDKELRNALGHEHSQHLRLCLLNLALIYETNTVIRALEVLLEGHTGSKPNVLESLEVMIKESFANDLIEELEANEASIRLTSPKTLIEQVKNDGLSEFTRWTLAIFLNSEIEYSLKELKNLIDFPSSIIAEQLLIRLSDLKDNHSTAIKEVMEQHHNSDNRLSQIERVILLKGTDVFKSSPEHILVDVAASLKEEMRYKDEKLFSKGDMGDYMYIIYSGEVKIHDAETTFAKLGSRDFFGEFALLDSEPRSADATVAEDALLLRLNREIFYELMSDRIEFAKGILQTLVNRLRSQNEKLRELRN